MKFYDSLLFSCLLLGEQSSSVLFLYYAIVAASSPGGSLKGAAAPFMAIRSGGMYGARSKRSLLPLSLEVCSKGARTSDVFP